MACDYPLFLDLAGRCVVVVGGGAVAARKVDKLLAAGARVRVVAPQIGPGIESRRNAKLEVVREEFAPSHVTGAALVFACTNDPVVNWAVARAARAAGAWANRADDPDDCDFTVPAVSEHGPIRLAVSTGGTSPALARTIRQWLDEHVPREWAALAVELARARPIVQQRVGEEQARRAIWDTLCGADSLQRLSEQGPEAWRAWLEQLIAPPPAR